MNDYDDEPDPEYRTPDERERDEEDERRLQAAARLLNSLDELDAEQEALERLADVDPMGFVFSGQAHDGRTAEQADQWLDARLSGKPAE